MLKVKKPTENTKAIFKPRTQRPLSIFVSHFLSLTGAGWGGLALRRHAEEVSVESG